ncbi:gas vesicle protein GvpL [Halohasta litorea]|uniref:Gas vesicle protein GvpL n=1 Tax=Halohasta litorea TaxID=869891 RepID=A0ABD6D4G7_9EURY|nr:GvpL/GvpF family gas vesicle protein [Halohasta litorea]
MTEIERGRYLYCLVYIPSADEDTNHEVAPDWSTEGIDDEPVSVITAGDVGAVVHACDSLYDTDDPQTIQQWLLSHQGVVDEAGEVFGTPIPFQFDTILTGGDEAVRDWLRSESDRLEPELSALAGHWEYRIEVTHHEDARSAIADNDEELSALSQRIDDAAAGTSYLLEQQYDKEINKRLRQHRQQQARSIADRIAPHVDALESLGKRRSTGVDIDTGRDDEPEPIARFAVLATDEGAEALGEELDAIAAEPGLEVRFTGPWPPYTFAPEIDSHGGQDGTDR